MLHQMKMLVGIIIGIGLSLVNLQSMMVIKNNITIGTLMQEQELMKMVKLENYQ